MNTKGFYKVMLLSLVLLFVSCSKETQPYISLNTSNTEVEFYANTSKSISFTSAMSWTAKLDDECSWLEVSPLSGGGSDVEQSIVIKNLKANDTNEQRSATITINSGDITKTIIVTQNPAFIFNEIEYKVDADGGNLDIPFQCVSEDPDNEVDFMVDKVLGTMLSGTQSQNAIVKSSVASRAYNEYVIKLNISSNTSDQPRKGSFLFEYNNNGAQSCIVTIIQDGKGMGESTDTSTNDGKVKELQLHSIGAGIPVVLMGDGFLDTDITNGTYDKAMSQAMEYLFSIEPTKTFKDYFDVYSVTAVSKNNVFMTGYSTAFSCTMEPSVSTEINGDADKIITYAGKAISDSKKLENDALVIVVLNSAEYAGTCVIGIDSKEQDIPNSYSIAYVPMTDGSKYYGIGFEQVLHHEAIGHGFGKLNDEYSYAKNGTISQSKLEEIIEQQKYGLWKNVDSHSDVTQTQWAKFAANSSYVGEKLGAYKGACTYADGIYRPTETSIMVSNDGVFNAPSREAIYKRIMNIANNHTYTYDYNEFLRYDVVNLSSRSSWSAYSRASSLPPLASPKVVVVDSRK